LVRLSIALGALAVVAAAVLWVGDLLFGVHGPSHYVSITNDTGASLTWSCSWSDLHLAAGETGQLRILDQPDQDYGCVPQAATPFVAAAHNNDICPSLTSMTEGRQFTATDFAKTYRCP
jgi:hypothetical protein